MSAGTALPREHRTPRGRRARLDATVLLAVVLPPLTVLTALGVREQAPGADAGHPPIRTALRDADVVCPSGPPRAAVATAGGRAGTVAVRFGDDTTTSARVAPRRLTTVAGGRGPLVVSATGRVAPGLLAGRAASPLAVAECGPPEADVWFTGVGAGARHTSVLELVNPDAGPAVVDVTVHGRTGQVDAPALRGVAVPARGSVRFDLAEVVPRRDELALHLVTTRGRVAASVLDRLGTLAGQAQVTDWLPAQTEPARSNLLVGMPARAVGRVLVVANPGDDQARATVRLVTRDAVLAPAGLDELSIAPQSVAKLDLTDVLRGPAAEGAVGVQVDSPQPLTVSLRSRTGQGLADTISGTPVSGPTAAVVPLGRAQLVVAGAEGPGAVSVVARSEEGRRLTTTRVEVAAGRAATVDLPKGTRLLEVSSSRTRVTAAVVVDAGADVGVVRLRPLLRSALVPDVRPTLP